MRAKPPLGRCFHHCPLPPTIDTKKKSISSELWQFYSFYLEPGKDTKGLLVFFRALTSNPPFWKREKEKKRKKRVGKKKAKKARTMASDFDLQFEPTKYGEGLEQYKITRGMGPTQEHLKWVFSGRTYWKWVTLWRWVGLRLHYAGRIRRLCVVNCRGQWDGHYAKCLWL